MWFSSVKRVAVSYVLWVDEDCRSFAYFDFVGSFEIVEEGILPDEGSRSYGCEEIHVAEAIVSHVLSDFLNVGRKGRGGTGKSRYLEGWVVRKSRFAGLGLRRKKK